MVLAQAGFEFTVYPSNFVEDLDSESDPYKLVSQLSVGKAKAVAGKFENAVVVGADTVVFYGGEFSVSLKPELKPKKCFIFYPERLT